MNYEHMSAINKKWQYLALPLCTSCVYNLIDISHHVTLHSFSHLLRSYLTIIIHIVCYYIIIDYNIIIILLLIILYYIINDKYYLSFLLLGSYWDLSYQFGFIFVQEQTGMTIKTRVNNLRWWWGDESADLFFSFQFWLIWSVSMSPDTSSKV